MTMTAPFAYIFNVLFPDITTHSTAHDTFEPTTTIFNEYDKFPTFKTSYRDSKNNTISYSSGRPDWEPYDWFFSQIRWSHAESSHAYSFTELAIAAHILTKGATSPAQDLYTKTKCMNLAFKRYYQKTENRQFKLQGVF